MDRFQAYNITLKNISEGFILVDHEGNIVDFNEAAEKITGYSKNDVMGKSHFEILHGTSDQDICSLFKFATKHRKKTISAETTVKRKDGDHVLAAITSFPIFDKDGTFKGGVELLQDITKSKKREKEKKLFLSMYVHDMKNPVIASKGFLSRLMAYKAGPLTEKQRDYLKLVSNSLSKLEMLVGEFLEFAKFEAKKFKPSFSLFNMVEALNKNIKTLKIESEKKRVYMIYEPSTHVHLVKADERMMNRVISNLLINAIKYTELGGVIKVRCLDTERDVLVQVINSGATIPEKHLPYIFEAFYRVRSADKGSGLGLAISKKIIELHSGKIWVHVKPEKETVFSFTLPKRYVTYR